MTVTKCREMLGISKTAFDNRVKKLNMLFKWDGNRKEVTYEQYKELKYDLEQNPITKPVKKYRVLIKCRRGWIVEGINLPLIRAKQLSRKLQDKGYVTDIREGIPV